MMLHWLTEIGQDFLHQSGSQKGKERIWSYRIQDKMSSFNESFNDPFNRSQRTRSDPKQLTNKILPSQGICTFAVEAVDHQGHVTVLAVKTSLWCGYSIILIKERLAQIQQDGLHSNQGAAPLCTWWRCLSKPREEGLGVSCPHKGPWKHCSAASGGVCVSF